MRGDRLYTLVLPPNDIIVKTSFYVQIMDYFKQGGVIMHTIEARLQQSFLRNEFDAFGKWNIPIVKRIEMDLNDIDLISYTDIKSGDSEENKKKGVHFFIDDYRMEGVYYNFDRSLLRLGQYRFLLTPDYSLYAEMPRAVQLFNVFRNRWCGAFWQKNGLTVIPTISWSDASSIDFCFDGVEEKSIVGISMIGCKRSKRAFLYGYSAMIEKINPKAVICLGVPFSEMSGNIISIDYQQSRRVNRNGR